MFISASVERRAIAKQDEIYIKERGPPALPFLVNPGIQLTGCSHVTKPRKIRFYGGKNISGNLAKLIFFRETATSHCVAWASNSNCSACMKSALSILY